MHLYSQLTRAERLIAGCRVVLAAFSLCAIWLDPTEPSRHESTAYVLLAAYLAYSLAVAVFVSRFTVPPPSFALGSHAFDLLIGALVMFFTEQSTSPFFTYFVFALVSATLRWQSKGTLWTGAVALASYVLLGVSTSAIFQNPQVPLDRMVIRATYLVVISILLWHFGRYEAKRRRELESLAAWPRQLPAEFADALRSSLAHAAQAFGASRAAVVWEETDEPWLYVALWSEGRLTSGREPPGKIEPPFALRLAGRAFLCLELSESETDVLVREEEKLSRWHGVPIHPTLLSRLGGRSALGLPLEGETFTGRLLVMDKGDFTTDDFTLSAVVVRQLSADLDQVGLVDRLRRASAAEERVRLARDLHDGVVQSLAAAGIKLEVAVGALATAPERARDQIRDVQALLVDEQRSLRAIAGSLKPVGVVSMEPEVDLLQRLREVTERIERSWGLCTDLCVDSSLRPLSAEIAHDACRMVHEALVNAVRHGNASSASVDVQQAPRELRITVSDDGRGFPATTAAEPSDAPGGNQGPWALRERVRALGGSLSAESTNAGARIEIVLPLGGSEQPWRRSE
ncbi:MAG: sensor histidine kinase [Deltaproteobacteria bacterium]|nr:sensor histidine kinase [Deltaproteobacteria bacterium]